MSDCDDRRSAARSTGAGATRDELKLVQHCLREANDRARLFMLQLAQRFAREQARARPQLLPIDGKL